MHADTRSWAGLFAGAAIALVAMAAGNFGSLVNLMDAHPGVAGWAQAIGSIGAIFSGFELARQSVEHGIRADGRRRRDQIRNARRLAVELASIAEDRIGAAQLALQMPLPNRATFGWVVHQRTVEADWEVMRTFDLHHLGNRKAMQCFALVTGFLRTVMDCLEPLTDPKIEGKTRAQALAAAKEAVVEILGRCSDVVRLMREELDPLIEVDGR